MAGLIDKNKKMEFLITPKSPKGDFTLRTAVEDVRNNRFASWRIVGETIY